MSVKRKSVYIWCERNQWVKVFRKGAYTLPEEVNLVYGQGKSRPAFLEQGCVIVREALLLYFNAAFREWWVAERSCESPSTSSRRLHSSELSSLSPCTVEYCLQKIQSKVPASPDLMQISRKRHWNRTSNPRSPSIVSTRLTKFKRMLAWKRVQSSSNTQV